MVVRVVVVEAALVVALGVIVVMVVELVALFMILLWSFWVSVVMVVKVVVRGVVVVVALEVAGAWLTCLFFKGNTCLFLSFEVVLLYDF